MLVGTRYQAALVEKRACDYFQRSKAGIKAVFNVTAMERSILAELFERGGRGQLSGLRDRRPIERLVNKGFVNKRNMSSQPSGRKSSRRQERGLESPETGSQNRGYRDLDAID